MCLDCQSILLEYIVNDGDFALRLATSGSKREQCVACRLVDSSLAGEKCNIVS